MKLSTLKSKLLTLSAASVGRWTLDVGRWTLFALLCVGCSMVSGTRKPDGELVVTSWRMLWKSEAVDFSITEIQPSPLAPRPSTPFTARLVIGKSSSDDAAVGAVTEGAVKGATRL
jgi:hypothetical protein